MSETNEKILKARKEFLSSIKNPEVSSEHLVSLLDEAEKKIPDLLSDFQPGKEKDSLSSDHIDWSDKYFSRHVVLAEHNFSRERIEHLIDIREHLRQLGVKGFSRSPNKTSYFQTEPPHSGGSHYLPSAQLKKFVVAGDLLTIRTALHMELNNNSLTGNDLRAALSWTKSRVPNLFEEYSERAFAHGMKSDCKLWTSQYYDEQIVFLKTNFSEQRLLHLIDVRDLLRQNGVEGFNPIQPSSVENSNLTYHLTATPQPRSGQSQHSEASPSSPGYNPMFKTALMIGGAVAALAALLLSILNGRN